MTPIDIRLNSAAKQPLQVAAHSYHKNVSEFLLSRLQQKLYLHGFIRKLNAAILRAV